MRCGSSRRQRRAEGAGHNYLVHALGRQREEQLHRLARAPAGQPARRQRDQKVFDSVIVVTDRRVLDQQLQDTIYQFEHKQGVVQKIDEDSTQLAEALKSGVPIIITTLAEISLRRRQGQATLPARRICGDRGRSTQLAIRRVGHRAEGRSGGHAIKGKAPGRSGRKGTAGLRGRNSEGDGEARAPEAISASSPSPPRRSTRRWRLFGRRDGTASHEPFHLYSMRQAIEEGFILDVLKNYTTYKTYLPADQSQSKTTRSWTRRRPPRRWRGS